MKKPGFIKFFADRGLRTTADAAKYLQEKIVPSYAQFGFGFYRLELRESGRPIGICGLIKRETLDSVDLGYSVLERFSGQGYAFEAATAVMDYGRNALGLPKIVGVTAPDNRVSIRLLEKLGLKYDAR